VRCRARHPGVGSRRQISDTEAKQFGVPNIGFTIQRAAVEKGIAKQFPLILSSGRLVEYEGGGEETRSNNVARRIVEKNSQRSSDAFGFFLIGTSDHRND
jgi:hypothetical protein